MQSFNIHHSNCWQTRRGRESKHYTDMWLGIWERSYVFVLLCLGGKLGTFQHKTCFLLFLIIQCRDEQRSENCWREQWLCSGDEGEVYCVALLQGLLLGRSGSAFQSGNTVRTWVASNLGSRAAAQ